MKSPTLGQIVEIAIKNGWILGTLRISLIGPNGPETIQYLQGPVSGVDELVVVPDLSKHSGDFLVPSLVKHYARKLGIKMADVYGTWLEEGEQAPVAD